MHKKSKVKGPFHSGNRVETGHHCPLSRRWWPGLPVSSSGCTWRGWTWGHSADLTAWLWQADVELLRNSRAQTYRSGLSGLPAIDCARSGSARWAQCRWRFVGAHPVDSSEFLLITLQHGDQVLEQQVVGPRELICNPGMEVGKAGFRGGSWPIWLEGSSWVAAWPRLPLKWGRSVFTRNIVKRSFSYLQWQLTRNESVNHKSLKPYKTGLYDPWHQ